MKKLTLTTIAVSAFGIGAALAGGTVAPSDVKYDEGTIATSLTGVPGNAANGPEIMNKGAGNCIACHEVTALKDFPFHGEVGPSLDGVGDRWTEAELRGIVANAKMMFDESMMPSFYRVDGFIRPGDAYTGNAAEGPLDPLLSAQQVEDVVAFLLTLKDN